MHCVNIPLLYYNMYPQFTGKTYPRTLFLSVLIFVKKTSVKTPHGKESTDKSEHRKRKGKHCKMDRSPDERHTQKLN